MATTLEIDAVIDPADTRQWLVAGLQSGRVQSANGPLAIDTW
jgi:acetyl-CoA carboxylase carboxyltransferase component